MSVEFVRPEVDKKKAAWKLVRDAVAGSDAVKDGGYIIPVNPNDESVENSTRNKQRVKRAVYVNATGRTLSALVGIAYGKWPEIKLPAALDSLLRDADGSGVGLVNQSQSVVSEVMQAGRAGLLADYPRAEGSTTRAAAEAMFLHPTISLYAAESIINWRTERRGSRNMLTLVVLAETYEEWDEFERKEKPQYRVLRLQDGRYVQEVWRESNAAWAIDRTQSSTPTDGAGNPWTEIPFTFVGATNNDATPDQPPLYDLATLNVAHLNNSADHEESLFFAGQAQVWLTGQDINEEQIALMQKEGMYVGSRSIGIAPGGVVMLQAQPVTGLSEEMKHKVELMGFLGAKLIAPGEANRTATESASDDKTSNSVLSIVCDNVSDAYRTALRWVAKFAHTPVTDKTLDFTISTEFAGVQFDAQQMAQALAGVQSGKLPESDFWTYCRAIGLIASDKSDEEVRDELSTQGPSLGLIGDNEPPTTE